MFDKFYSLLLSLSIETDRETEIGLKTAWQRQREYDRNRKR